MFAASSPARHSLRRTRERVFLILGVCAILTGVISDSLAQTQSAPIHRTAAGAAGLRVDAVRAPLSFEQNLGQDPSEAPYIAYGPGYLLRLEASRASIVFGEHAGASSFSLDFTGANARATITAAEPQAGTHSYFRTGDKARWLPSVPTYSRVQYAGVYPGIDLSFYGHQRRLEYDFIVQPGGEPKSIRMALDGAEQVALDAAGGLSMRASGSPFTLLKPVAYQVAADGVTREPVEAAYRLSAVAPGHHAAASFVFSVGKYDRRRPLIIDPVLLYGLDIPGAEGLSDPPYYFADTAISAMTVDGAGNTYVAATVSSSYADTSVLKFDPSGHLLYNVSLGSPSVYIGVNAIAIDAAGDVYLAGSALPGLPTTPNALEPVSGQQNNYAGFLSVIKADASALLYSSYLGSSVGSTIYGLAVDTKGQAYVTGSTTSSGFPTTPGVFEPTVSTNYQGSGFVAKLDPTLSGQASLVYSTFLASQSAENENTSYSTGYGIAVDAGGNAYVISEGGSGFPTTAGAYQFDGISPAGAYLTKLNAAATTPVYSAFLGPGYPAAIALDGDAEAYVTGSPMSGEFPTTAGAYQTTYPGGFALKLSADGSTLIYSTFLGGPSETQSYELSPASIAVTPGCASACNAYIAGTTASIDFPLVFPLQSFPGTYLQQTSGQTEEQGFLVDLASNGGSVAFSTYLGAANSPTYRAPVVGADASGNLYFASNVEGPDAPVTLPAVQNPGEGFLLKIGLANAGRAVVTPNQVDFSTQAVHSTSATPVVVELRNMGSAAITLQRPFLFSSKEFAEADSCGSILAGGGLCTLQISFTPVASGVRSGTLAVGSSGAASPAIVALSGTAVDGPNLIISATALTFADQVVDGSGVTQSVTLTNSGDQPQPIIAIGTNLPDYVSTSTCGNLIAPGVSCKVNVLFKPTQIGLRSDYLSIEVPSGTGPYYDSLPMTGTGVLGAAGTGTVTLTQGALNFDSIVVGSGATQGLTVINSGDAPVTINSITVTTSKGGASDFAFVPPGIQGGYPSGSTCGEDYYYGSSNGYALPYTLAPQSSCSIDVTFGPSIAGQETGTLTIADSAAGSPHTAGLSGVGLLSVQALTVTPATLAFPAQPIGDPSAAQTFTLTNGGEDYVLIDRVTTTGDFAIDDLNPNNCEEATLGPLGSCEVSVAFNPSATGARAGTLVLLDTVSGTPQVFNLAGTGVQATGALQLGQTSLVFPAQASGTSSASEDLILSNPGNSPITINSLVTTGDFAVTTPYYYSDLCGGVLPPASTCQAQLTFSPTKASGPETGTLTIHSTVGNDTVNLSGTTFTASQTIHLTPTQANFGNVLFAPPSSGTSQITAFIENTGTAPVAFSTVPTITGTGSTPAADFVLSSSNCYPDIPFYSYDSPGSFPAGQSCSFTITFTPSTAGREQATLTFVDSAGTQTMALTGTGVNPAPTLYTAPAMLAFGSQPVGSSSSTYYFSNYFYLYNTGTTSVVINSETVTAGSSDFSLFTPNGTCAGQTIAPGSACYSSFVFTPSAVGYRTGTVSYVSSTGITYTAALAGYGIAKVNTASLSPQSLLLPSTAANAGTTSSSEPTSVSLTNTGNAPLVVGTVSGSNVSTTGDFTIIYPGGTDYCSGVTLQPGYSCGVNVGFTPRATGVRTGSLTFPVTYADKTTASLTASLSGTGLARVGSGSLLPQLVTYPAQVAGFDTSTYQDEMQLTLTNSGTVQMTPGTLTGTNLGTTAQAGSDFLLAYNQCMYPLAPGESCQVQISFDPINRGPKTSYITIPVTYAGGGTGSFTSKLAGNSVAPAPELQLSQAALNFNVEVVGTTDLNNVETATLASVGNVPVTITSITASANFTVTSNQCGSAVSQQSTCYVTVAFTPFATTAPGQVNGTLTVVDNAPGSPHVIKLGGTAIATAQQLALSQTSVMFPAQTAGTTSAPQVVYLTDLGSSGSTQGGGASRVQINSIKLGGADPADFTESENCGGTLGFTIAGRQGCMITVAFAPASSARGTLTATVTITPAQGAALVIQLVGISDAELITKAQKERSVALP
jgi:hypothetical protein